VGSYSDNVERTAEYLKSFDREKTLKYLIKTIRPVIFDVGANMGSSVDEFKSWWPCSEIHCFEPQHECWVELEQREKRYYNEGKVVVNRVAAGNMGNDKEVFYSHDITTGQSGFNKINMQSLDSINLKKLPGSDSGSVEEYEKSINQERWVKILRLDDYMATSGVSRVSLLKVDTQGFEPEVLEGLGQRLSDIDVVVTELMFYDFYERSLSFSEIERFLLPAGFALYDISHISKNPMNGRTDWVDVIYLNNRLRTGS
jgi:FkbM family methyltransferase